MTFPYGGDYNPEQWPREVWEADHGLFDAAGINTLTVGVFMWSLLQPDEDTYDFATLDAIVERAAGSGRQIVLATPSGAMPPWLGTTYPGANRVDFEGRRHGYGARHNACPSDPDHRRLAVEMARRLAERYGAAEHLIAWHVANEYGGRCYCEQCAAAFRVWLAERYGTLAELNRAWYTTFWSHRFTDWGQIVPPTALTEHWNGPRFTAFQGITLDYARFQSDALLACFRAEADVLRELSPGVPVTTNFMGLYGMLDYFRWAPHLDFVSWDNYPPGLDQAPRMALAHDLMRGLKGGDPFWVMEQTPSTTACRTTNPLRPPGVVRLWSHQGIAHGADAILYFQMRQSRGACEKYHGAVISHDGRSDTRVFREVVALGAELPRLDAVRGARSAARVALLWDWDAWWALELSDGPNRLLDYRERVLAWYSALWRRNVAVDVLHPSMDFSGYDLVLAPSLHLVANDLGERVAAYVTAGGRFATGALSGRVDGDDLAYLGDQPVPFARTLGLRVEETDTLEPAVTAPLAGEGVAGAATLVCERLVLDGAEPLASYGHGWVAGAPAVTRHRHGLGEAWYAATELDDEGLDWLAGRLFDGLGVGLGYPGLEAVERVRDGGRVLFLLNHGPDAVAAELDRGGTDLLTGRGHARGDRVEIPPSGVVILG